MRQRLNGEKLLKALLESGLGTAEMVSVDELLANEITVFNDFIRLDVQTFTPGIGFHEAWKNRNIMNFEGQEFNVLSKADLIASKMAAGRDIDVQDATALAAADNPDD